MKNVFVLRMVEKSHKAKANKNWCCVKFELRWEQIKSKKWKREETKKKKKNFIEYVRNVHWIRQTTWFLLSV